MNNLAIKNKLVKLVKRAYKKIKNLDKEVALKGSKDLLTTADLTVEKFLITQINKFMPNVPIISEEYNFDKKTSKEYFTIDPIDGTINYANGLDIWGIQVAYINNFEKQVAVIYFPKLKKIYSAIKDKDAFLKNKKICVNNTSLENGIVGIDFSKANPKNFDIAKNISKEVMRTRNLGAACFGFSMVAEGSIIAYILFQNTVWDIDPGYLLCKEAGAYIERNEVYTIAANTKETLDTLKNILKN